MIKPKLSFISKLFGLMQVMVGLASLWYVWVEYQSLGGLQGLTYAERDIFNMLFLRYGGGGVIQLFTAGCILTRQAAVPVLAFLVGAGSIAIRIPILMKDFNIHERPTQIAIVAFMYICWFMLRRKEFAE